MHIIVLYDPWVKISQLLEPQNDLFKDYFLSH